MTNTELVILSLVAEQPRHGYEMEQIIKVRGMREWTEIGFSSIYYLLKKLEREGLIEGRLEEAEKGPARKVYSATAEGKDALHAGVLNALSTPHHSCSPLQLGLSNLPIIPFTEARDALQQYRDSLQNRSVYLKMKWEEQSPLPYFVTAMFDFSITMIEAESGWIDGFIRIMENENAED